MVTVLTGSGFWGAQETRMTQPTRELRTRKHKMVFLQFIDNSFSQPDQLYIAPLFL
jgi:hypothetical protein